MKNLTKHNHIFANFEYNELPAIKQDKEAYENLMWHIIDGIRLYDLWMGTGVYENGEEVMLEQVTNHLRFRYDSIILHELLDFVCDKAYDLDKAILAISEKNEDGFFVTPLGLGDDSTSDWCKFVVGIGREYYEEIISNQDALREACGYTGFAIECFTYAISQAIDIIESEEE